MSALATSRTLRPAERVAIAALLDQEHRPLDDETLSSALVDWPLLDHQLREDLVRRAATVLRAAGVDPELLRWCDWPECLASFVAVPGPAERGWMRHPYALLCPTHAPLGHGPSVKWDGNTLTALCACGESDAVSPTNGAAVKAWWHQHVLTLAKEEHR